jgi:N-acetylglutamate synthase-like GNAT family acetyltransferase
LSEILALLLNFKMMIIRLATLKDIGPVMQLIGKVVPLMMASGNFQWDDKYPNRHVFNNDVALNQLWVAEIDNQVAGVTAITTDQQAEYANLGMDITQEAIVTHRLAVDIDFRRQGIAEALLKKAEDVALARGIKILRIDTNSNNKVTRKLFPKMGYEYAGETPLAFRPGLRFYCYEKILAND